MSRVGKKPIIIPAGVEVSNVGNVYTVKGPKGTLTRELAPEIKVIMENNEITFERPNDEPFIRALHGTTRANVNNMVIGVSEGFKIKLELVGVGYRVTPNGKGMTLALGYSHPVEIAPVEGINFIIEGNTKITVEGIDKQLVGQIASDIRSKRAPEPYKGKGIKYSNEVIRRKEGKKG